MKCTTLTMAGNTRHILYSNTGILFTARVVKFYRCKEIMEMEYGPHKKPTNNSNIKYNPKQQRSFFSTNATLFTYVSTVGHAGQVLSSKDHEDTYI